MAQKTLASPQGESIGQQSSIGRVAQPEEVGQIVAYLALEAPVFMTGCIVDINGASYLRS
jgi:NAD(P)-dependent dehydrogenase (short-subunit alcohol dehydrogenase family)